MKAVTSFALFAACAALVSSARSATIVIPTSKGMGADAEVRDHQPTTNFGASTELATRILDNVPAGDPADGNDRFSAMYLRFDVTGTTAPSGSSLRLTFRNTNLSKNRLEDTATPNPAFRTGIAFYALDRDDPGNNWGESTITYLNAPGMGSVPGFPALDMPGGDFDNGTKDLDFRDPDGSGTARNATLTPLGVALFPILGNQNHLPVGGELLFSSPALNNFVAGAINAGKQTVTIVAAIQHDGKVPVNDWKNFNYLFNPKEQTTLVADSLYDSDTTNPDNPLGSPFSAASNATDANGFSPFSPQLILQAVPEPTGLALAGAALAAMLVHFVYSRRCN